MLQGYEVNVDVSVGSGVRGGRRDIDIVAVDDQKQEVVLIEMIGIGRGDIDKICKRACSVLEPKT